MSDPVTVEEIFDRIHELDCPTSGRSVTSVEACGWCEPCELWELVERYRREQAELERVTKKCKQCGHRWRVPVGRHQCCPACDHESSVQVSEP